MKHIEDAKLPNWLSTKMMLWTGRAIVFPLLWVCFPFCQWFVFVLIHSLPPGSFTLY